MQQIVYKHGALKRDDLIPMKDRDLIVLYNRIVRDGVKAGLDQNRYKQIDRVVNQDETIKRAMMMHSSVTAILGSNVVELPIKTISSMIKGNGFDNEAKLTLIKTENPKKGKSRDRYECYRHSLTIGDYIHAVGNRTLAIADLKWDKKRGHIHWE